MDDSFESRESICYGGQSVPWTIQGVVNPQVGKTTMNGLNRLSNKLNNKKKLNKNLYTELKKNLNNKISDIFSSLIRNLLNKKHDKLNCKLNTDFKTNSTTWKVSCLITSSTIQQTQQYG